MNVITKHKRNDNDDKDDKNYINIKNDETKISSPTTSLRKRFQNDGNSIANKSNRLFYEIHNDEQQSPQLHYLSHNQRTSALTLPMHISHLPLNNINQRKSLQLSQSQVAGKLSARYINNTGSGININKSRKSLSMDEKQYHQQTISYNKNDEIAVNKNNNNNEKLNTNLIININNNNGNDKDKLHHFQNEIIDEEALSATSTLLCYCEKTQNNNSDTFNIIEKDDIRTKRLVSTRNAATSPHLDARKMNNLTTLTATMYLKKSPQLEIESDNKDDFLKNQRNENDEKIVPNDVNGDDNDQYKLVKTQSIKENKPIKYFRTTRSLSPRPPPIKHQSKTIEKDIGLDYEIKAAHEPLSMASSRINRAIMELRQRKGENVCKSEQSSPNIFDDDDKIKFAYNQATTNCSTGCLVYIPSDPWLKMTDNQRDDVGNVNPWVKRPNERLLKRQSKSLQTSTPAQISSEIMSAESIKTSLSPIRMVNTKQCTSNVPGDSQKSFQLSAPSSPHFLNTPENPFSSVYSLNSAYVGVDHHHNQHQHQHPYHYQYYPTQHGHHLQQTSINHKQHPYRHHYYYPRTEHLIGDVKDRCTPPPIRSSSFSPGHSRDANNPFLDATISIQQLLPSSPPPIIAILSEAGEKKDNNDYDSYDKSNFSQRHCFNTSSTTSNALTATAKFTNGRNNDSFLLGVCNPNMLQARHSFSSVTNTMVSGLSDEIPLNIRRLSDQMRRKETFSPNFIGKDFANNNFNNDYKLNFNSLSKIEKKIKSSITTLTTTSATVAITTATPVAIISDMKKVKIMKSEDSKSFEINDLTKRTKKTQNKLIIQDQLSWPKRTSPSVSPPLPVTIATKEIDQQKILKQQISRKISGKSSTDSLLETTC